MSRVLMMVERAEVESRVFVIGAFRFKGKTDHWTACPVDHISAWDGNPNVETIKVTFEHPTQHRLLESMTAALRKEVPTPEAGVMERAEIERLLAEATASPGDSWNLWAPELAELCRTWLAVQDAPVTTIRAGWHESASISYDGYSREQAGQVVRLVAAADLQP